MNYFVFVTVVLFLSSLTFVSSKLQIVFDSRSLAALCVGSALEDNGVAQDIQHLKRRRSPCPVPVPELRSGHDETAVTGDFYTEPPEWLNVTLATIGQDFMRKNFVGYTHGIFLTTMLLATIPEIARIITSANQHLSPREMEKRFMGNTLNFMFWANANIGPGPDIGHHLTNPYRWNQSSLYDGLNLIRSIHSKLVYQTSAIKERYTVPSTSREIDNVTIDDAVWDAFQKDLESSHLAGFKNKDIFPPRNTISQFPFNQFQMALQYWGHIASPFFNPEKSLFIANPTEEELLGYLHFWSFLAHVMGMREEYNVCLQPSIPATKKYFQEILEEFIVPGLFRLEYESKVLIESYIKGFAPTFPFMDVGLMVKLMAEDILGIKTETIQKVLSPQARLYSTILRTTRRSVKNPRINASVRFIMNGLVQVRTLNLFGFDILAPDAFVNGLLQSNENFLDVLEVWGKKGKRLSA